MTEDRDPFRHMPALREKIVDPATSFYRHFDLDELDAQMRAAGAPEDWRRTDADREATRRRTLAGREEGALWVFAYGSLIWDPGFLFDEVRTGTVNGFHRSFCLHSELGRGTPDKPGLMAGLDRGGECTGLVFRIARERVEAESKVIWRREMLMHAYAPRFVAVETLPGPVEALAFVVDPASPVYRPGLDPEETARRLATGAGMLGTSLAYVENLIEHLDAVGIEDRDLAHLYGLARVA